MNEWIHTHTPTHTMEYYLAMKKNVILSFAAKWLKLEHTLGEISQAWKDKYHLFSQM
jgi:hypothetical protein